MGEVDIEVDGVWCKKCEELHPSLYWHEKFDNYIRNRREVWEQQKKVRPNLFDDVMVKLLKKILIVVGLLCLGGCSLLENKNTREYMEKHFSYLEKVYPTKNVEELFEKFPNGVKIRYNIAKEQENGSLDSSIFDLIVDSNQYRIYGTERKVNILHPKVTEIYTENVEYKNGEITYPENPKMSSQKLVFLFEKIDYSALRNCEVIRVRYDYQQPLYSIQYWMPTNMIEKTIPENEKAYIYVKDYGKKGATVEVSNVESMYIISEEFIEGDSNDK